MPKLNKSARLKIAESLRGILPTHWSVTVGGDYEAWVLLDQGAQNDSGSTLISIENTPDDSIAILPYYRIVQPMTECVLLALYEDGPYFVEGGRGWPERVAEEALCVALFADTELLSFGDFTIGEA